MSTVEMVKVGALTAQAVIDAAAEQNGSAEAGALRIGVLEFLRLYGAEVAAESSYTELLDAYRDWLETAVALFGTGDRSHLREYLRRGAILTAELELSDSHQDAATQEG